MDMVIFLSVGLVIGGVIGVLLGKIVFASASGDAATVAGLTATNAAMLDQVAELKTQIESMREAERLRLAEDNAVINKLEPVTLMLKQLGDTVRTMEN